MILDEAYRRNFSQKYDLRISPTAEAGLEAMESWRPDVVILDIYLPGKYDGIDVLREMKKNPLTMKIPVLVITNLPDAEEKVMELGASKCFMKTDVDLDLIGKTLNDILATSEK